MVPLDLVLPPTKGSNIPSRGCEHGVKITDAVQHCDGKSEAGSETNEDGRHQRFGNSLRCILALFCQMNGSVNARVNVVGICETSQEYDAVGGPPRVVDEGFPYELIRLE